MTLQGGRKRVVVVGQYRFTGKILGKGNFARVEEAVHNILNIKVAIKIMDINQIKEDYVIRNLCREAKIMAKLNHPCIAALYQTMQRSDNVYYLVTELVSGGDLCSFVKGQRHGKLEEKPTRMYARQFASALGHMHSIGVVHRDLKMENVMLNSIQTQIKIVDFGLSNVWSTENPLRTHCGSPEYAAPELFVTGKEYGAEVDLWSLGIILYGMVLGQLPFATDRNERFSSQERRKRLVAQINKGLSSIHRRCLAGFSSEFRHLMNRLLVADSSKRMTVKELLGHSWITEGGKRVVKINPMKRLLDKALNNKVISEISSLLQINSNHIITAIVQEPLGEICGTYNILSHKYKLSRLNGDGVTRTVLPLAMSEAEDFKRNNNSAEKIVMKTSVCKKPATAPGARKSEYNNLRPRTREMSRPVIKSTSKTILPIKTKNINTVPIARPNTVQALPSNQKNVKYVDYRTIKSPTLRRKAYSATLTPKTNRPQSRQEETSKKSPRTIQKKASVKEMYELKKHELDLKVKKKLDMIYNFGKTRSAEHKPITEMTSKEYISKIPISAEKSRCKSEQTATRKQIGLVPSLDFALKHLKLHGETLPQNNAQVTKPVKPLFSMTNPRRTPSEKKNIFDTQAQWERCVFAYGDSPIKPLNATPRQRKPLIYDPIARSIADYVVNNVPEKIHNLPWYYK